MEHEHKRRKQSPSPPPVEDAPDAPDGAAAPLHKCYMTLLPLELLAEVLSYLPSPRDILAIARTSKHFCAVLANNKATDFIWRQARARCQPQPIPDPTPDFTEASYAAFLFDSKTCEVCQKRTKEMYHSFALRASEVLGELAMWNIMSLQDLRSATALHRVTPQEEVEYPEFVHWLPQLERRNVYDMGVKVREDDWLQAVDEYKKVHHLGEEAVAAYVKEKQALADLMPAKRDLCIQLIRWGRSYEARRKEVLRLNHAKATSLAQLQGWQPRDLLQAPSYRLLHHSRNRSLEPVTDEDIYAIRGLLDAEIAAHRERKLHREQEKAQQIRLKQVRSEWDHMHTRELPAHVLPNLQEFRKLSVVKIYEAGPSGSEQHTLRDPFVSSVLAENLEQWREAARAGLAAVLGFPGWKNLSRRRLHPVDRLTARFRCTRCDAAASSGSKKVPEDGGMDFARACEHVCTHLPKKRRNKEKWSADRFVPDQRVLSLCGTTPEDVDSIRIADELGDRVQCQSCPCIMDVRSVDRHCKRHVDCSFTLANGPVEPPIEHGLAKKLLKVSRDTTPERDQKVFVCRHCTKPHSSTSEPHPPRLMTFNGLISHMKEKHLILLLADEDFYRQKAAGAIDDLA
ncbi:hypothetical protein OH76DRAFT_1421421 [Lentinus brumalis]|uniref:F-box domain-containing protein n=1 Tax=Lentinus brumalis TaxID=2498619 RepID=A0A371CVX6_9APHY|nr:hypothetical protein OH76DRAFT_1421421 [Polyporus brumalis]